MTRPNHLNVFEACPACTGQTIMRIAKYIGAYHEDIAWIWDCSSDWDLPGKVIKRRHVWDGTRH